MELLVEIYFLFPFCTLSFILSLLTMPEAWGHAFLRGECVTCMIFQGIQDHYTFEY